MPSPENSNFRYLEPFSISPEGWSYRQSTACSLCNDSVPPGGKSPIVKCLGSKNAPPLLIRSPRIYSCEQVLSCQERNILHQNKDKTWNWSVFGSVVVRLIIMDWRLFVWRAKYWEIWVSNLYLSCMFEMTAWNAKQSLSFITIYVFFWICWPAVHFSGITYPKIPNKPENSAKIARVDKKFKLNFVL